MWVEKNRGKLRLCERIVDLYGNRRKVSVPLVKDTPKERMKAMAELSQKLESFETDIEDVRLDSLAKKYINRDDIKDSTRKVYQNEYNKICSLFGNPLVSKLTPIIIKRVLLESDLPISTKNRYIKKLKMLIQFGFEYGYAEKPLNIGYFKVERKDDIEGKFLDGDELKEVLEMMVGTPDYYASKFLALTGCRVGEMAALLVSDYDGEYISISKTIYQGTLQTPKTPSSCRKIFCQKELRDFMVDYLSYRNLRLLATGKRTDALFIGEKCERFNVSTYTHRILGMKYKKHLHPHIFRHTHASLLAEQGYSLDAISRRLGHEDSEITKKIYLHTTEKVKRNDEKMLEKITLII